MHFANLWRLRNLTANQQKWKKVSHNNKKFLDKFLETGQQSISFHTSHDHIIIIHSMVPYSLQQTI